MEKWQQEQAARHEKERKELEEDKDFSRAQQWLNGCRAVARASWPKGMRVESGQMHCGCEFAMVLRDSEDTFDEDGDLIPRPFIPSVLDARARDWKVWEERGGA